MSMSMRIFRNCPICNVASISPYGNNLRCSKCGEIFKFDGRYGVWRNNSILDISYPDPESSVLSPLFPIKFTMETINGVKTFASMEAFLLTLQWAGSNSIGIFDELASLSGMDASRAKNFLPDWRKTQKVTWNRKTIERNSEEYQKLLKLAFDSQFEQSHLFRLGLMKAKNKILMHTMAECDPRKTLITQDEHIALLKRERSRLLA